MRVNRNHFGRQIESFQADLNLPFLYEDSQHTGHVPDTIAIPFRAIFIRAPIVEKLLPHVSGVQEGEATVDGTVVAPSSEVVEEKTSPVQTAGVEIMATLPGRTAARKNDPTKIKLLDAELADIVAVRQANVFGTSFHPELTGDPRIHVWWLEQVVKAVEMAHA